MSKPLNQENFDAVREVVNQHSKTLKELAKALKDRDAKILLLERQVEGLKLKMNLDKNKHGLNKDGQKFADDIFGNMFGGKNGKG